MAERHQRERWFLWCLKKSAGGLVIVLGVANGMELTIDYYCC